jgi:hypothetical protein
MNSTMKTFIGIMAFYVLLSYLIFPAIFYYFVEKSLMSAGNGFAVGSVLSIVLWYTFGKKMIR